MSSDGAIFDELLGSKRLQQLNAAIAEGQSLLVEELWKSSKSLVATLAQRATGKHILLLAGSYDEEQKLSHDFAFFSPRPVVHFPAWETLPNEAVPPSPDIVGERYKVLEAISSGKEPLVILTGLQACLQKLVLPSRFEELYLTLKVGQCHDFEHLIDKLKEMGYQQQSLAADKGEFAVRGGIIDLYPVATPDPYRIEFWDDEITSIRTYDPIGQKSIERVKSLQVTAAQEMELLDGSSLGTILDYLGSDVIVVFDDLLALEDRYSTLVGIFGKTTASFCSIDELMEQVLPLQKLFFTRTPIEEMTEVQLLEKLEVGYYSSTVPIHKVSFGMFNRTLEAGRWRHPFNSIRSYFFPNYSEDVEISGEELFLHLATLQGKTDCSLHLLCSTESEEVHMQKRLLDAKITLPPKTSYHIDYLSGGLVCEDIDTIILPMTELTGRYKIRRQKLRSTYHMAQAEVYDLAPGEMVVHINNGIGRYQGQEKRPDHNGVINEYLVIEYAGNSKLYVPMSQAYMITKYIGSHDETPKMHAIGSKQWQKTRERTYQAIIGYAKELLELYAKRELKGGVSFPPDGPDVTAFEEEFPFVETEDQLDAIVNIKEDMQTPKAMDRLICGDVGYGKTEVAMRAAFKTVVDGKKQVVVLVPTTVLAMQHYDNFVERMGNFPVKIAALSRFAKAKDRKLAIEGAASGAVDILIGTHRVIGKDIHFKDLGLVIIDEEHRFGVRAKEHLKKIRTGVDCLMLSATPIPRTLYMSLINARDMSVINTPPQDRLPIKTVICEPNDHVIKNALLRELSREGQAYYIHNRVETLPDVVVHLKKLLPQARVAMVHGQMDSEEIDTVFHAFKQGKVDVLVATTIVENGIDIPNANTIIIERADHFGLADLYQLRGRTGRWNRRAYAYFLVSRLHALPDLSRRRLNALAESTGYGGGMKLAMRDLEIRGAGDILGTEQSGHVSAIGFHFYCKMLKRAIQALKGEGYADLEDVKMEYPFSARLTEDYINSPNLRMEIYQRLGEAVTWEEVDAIMEEVKDRYGLPPLPALWLYHMARVRVFASRRGFISLKLAHNTLFVEKKVGGKPVKQKLTFVICDNPEKVEKELVTILTALSA